MKINFLTSGFTNGFTKEFVEEVNKYLKQTKTILFIASDFEEQSYALTDYYSKIFHDMFKEHGIVFENIFLIDYRMSVEKAKDLIELADFVWISGGDTLKQISYIKEYQLIDALRNRDGITMGMSAGSINMAKRVVLPKHDKDNVPELSVYNGIGLVDINIEPHLDLSLTDHIEEIKEAAKINTIYGLYDNSFVKVIEDEVEFFGDYIVF